MKLEDLGYNPKTKTHNGRLTRAESVFLGILWIDHVGELNAIAADALAIRFAYALDGKSLDKDQLFELRTMMKGIPARRRILDEQKRDVRRMHNHLLQEHSRIAILSKAGPGGGYWIAENEEEANAFYDTFRKRGLTGLVKASRGKKAVLVDMFQQLSFDFDLMDQTGLPAPDRTESSMPVDVVDRFLQTMLEQPERFSEDLRKLSQKFGTVLFTKVQAQAMKTKVHELNELVAGMLK